jgi:hypothetical protein
MGVLEAVDLEIYMVEVDSVVHNANSILAEEVLSVLFGAQVVHSLQPTLVMYNQYYITKRVKHGCTINKKRI